MSFQVMYCIDCNSPAINCKCFPQTLYVDGKTYEIPLPNVGPAPDAASTVGHLKTDKDLIDNLRKAIDEAQNNLEALRIDRDCLAINAQRYALLKHYGYLDKIIEKTAEESIDQAVDRMVNRKS